MYFRYTTFRKVDQFPSSVEGGGHLLELGPLEEDRSTYLH
jgi:hypothetical protein